jgi:hypothetical protein
VITAVARAPGLISVREPLGLGDMMGDGVIPLGARCGRSFFRLTAAISSASAWRQEHAGSRQRSIS